MRPTIPILPLVVVLLLPSVAGAQEPPDMDAIVEEANRKLDEWIDHTRAFVGDVRIDASDMESFLDHYDGFSSLGEQMSEDEEFVDYDQVLADPAYRAWAAANGLAPEPWLKRSMRIIALAMREQMQAGFAQAEAQMPEQRRMIEEQCAQADADMCQQMMASLDASMAMFEHQKKRFGDLPQPTDAERAVLERYADDVSALMESGDEDWDEEDWDEEDWEEEDWNEED